jgi:hypothetical protein
MISTNHSTNSRRGRLFVDVEGHPGLGSSPADILPFLKRLNHSQHCIQLIQSSPYAWLSNWNVSVKFYQVCSKFSLSLSLTRTERERLFFQALSLSLIGQTACAHAQFSGCSSTTNAHSETRQMAVCCQNLTLGVLSSSSPTLCAGWRTI